jgi:ABC-2 type transport system ATP-binding protein
MGAAGYIGRVGGLAVALGVGTAIVTGAGVAAAATGSEGDSPTASTSTSSGGGQGASNDKSAPKANAGPQAPGAAGKHRASTQSPSSSSSVTSIADRVGDTPHTFLKPSRDLATKAKAVATSLAASTPSPAGTESQATPVVTQAQSAANEWLASPKAVAGRTADVTLPAPSVATPSLSTVVGTFADALSPLSGNGPTGPIGSVADVLLLAGVRRETASAAINDAAAPTYTIGVDQGVITGCAVAGCTATPDGKTYTVIGAPSGGGKLNLNAATGQFTFLPFAPEGNTNGPTGTESFQVLVAQTTGFDTFVTGLPLVGAAVFAPLIVTLQQVPVVSVILSPLIGSAINQTITANAAVLRGVAQTPIAFTTKVTSFDGTQISTNFFPAIGVETDAQPGFETMFYGPGLASPGATDPTSPILAAFRNQGYNVVTWDPRGEFDSGGVLQLDSPQFEGRDVSQLITWVAGQNGVEQSVGSTIPDDPQIGMVGVSYGGGIQLVTAADDHRIDAIAPGWAWNSLPDSLYPDDAFRTAYSALLALDLITTGANINSGIYAGIITGALLGILTPDQIALLASSGPSITVSNITAPTLLIQGTVDVLFPLQQSVLNAGYLTFPDGNVPPTKVVWFCGGHGDCLPGQGNPDADTAWVLNESVAWMNRYVKDDGTTDPEVFEWSDQNGNYWSSETLPSDPAFYSSTVISSSGNGHLLPIIPILGGSGPQSQVALPYSLGLGSVANNAVNIQLTNPVAGGGTPVNVVGAPTLTMTYSGLGTSRHVYAQVVDKKTGLVVGNLVTPLPVTLDGQTHTMTYQLNDIAYTLYPDSDLEVQIVTTAVPFLNLTQFGFINVGAVTVGLPVAANATQVQEAVAV